MSARQEIVAWMRFIQQHGRGLCGKWPLETLADWLIWQLEHNLVASLWRGNTLCGLAIAWCCGSAQLGRQWVRHQPRGQCGWIELVVVRERSDLRPLLAQLKGMVPEWRRLRLFTRRRGKVRPFGRRKGEHGFDR